MVSLWYYSKSMDIDMMKFAPVSYYQCHITFSLIYFQNLVPQPLETELNQKILLCRLEAL